MPLSVFSVSLHFHCLRSVGRGRYMFTSSVTAFSCSLTIRNRSRAHFLPAPFSGANWPILSYSSSSHLCCQVYCDRRACARHRGDGGCPDRPTDIPVLDAPLSHMRVPAAVLTDGRGTMCEQCARAHLRLHSLRRRRHPHPNRRLLGLEVSRFLKNRNCEPRFLQKNQFFYLYRVRLQI